MIQDALRFERVQPVRLYERIVEQIEGAITRGELRPGERLPSERELVVQFGTSRATVREALRVLESTGVVRSRPGDPRGPEILEIDAESLRRPLARLAGAARLSLGQLIVSRMMLDSTANQLAAQLRTDEQLVWIERAVDTMRTALDEGEEAFSKADMAFHELITCVAGNPLIKLGHAAVRDTVLALISNTITDAADSRVVMQRSLAHHEEVLDAIRAGDGPRAAHASLRSLYEYYSGSVPETERAALKAMLPD
ncbi:MAG: GntR family transcriptional regulator [Intrasporangium sp.]|uniref:FadR/GntR family transcriptional regulator n=1 Tax=Intrasporangium sp. TaxID=1925024 RepID=UPI002648EBB6|nr:FCD domain-containing protein [Intrasporangium sp.]MDN5794876.1 GntR family transcriptional regulator [Intrasporangium sp.]